MGPMDKPIHAAGHGLPTFMIRTPSGHDVDVHTIIAHLGVATKELQLKVERLEAEVAALRRGVR